jgi:hypothetical protein
MPDMVEYLKLLCFALKSKNLVQDIAEAALTPGSEVPSHLIAALHDLMIEAFPIATFSDTVIKPQPGHQYYFEFNEETKLLVVLYVPASRRPSFVVRQGVTAERKAPFPLVQPCLHKRCRASAGNV